MSYNCYDLNCYYNCCNYYGYCPEYYSSSSYYWGQCWYYYDTGPSSGTIAGAVVGSIIGAIIILVIICYCWRHRQQQHLMQQAQINAMNKNDGGGTTIIMQNQQPAYQQPAYQQPAYGQPVYGQPQPGYYGAQQQQPIIVTG